MKEDCHGCKSYELARDSLIEIAASVADDALNGMYGLIKLGEWTDEQIAEWNRVYHAEMEKMVKERGLI